MVLRLLLAAVLAVGMASAQGKKGGGGGRGGDMGDMGMRQQRQTRMDVIAEKLKLNKDQKEEITKIFNNAQEKTSALNSQIGNGRGKMTEMLISGKNSGEEWDTLMKAFTAVLAQQEAIETDAYQKMYAALDEKQKSKAAAVFDEQMAGMFGGRDWNRTAGGMGMGGR